MAYKITKRDGIVIGSLCAMALGIVLISTHASSSNQASNMTSSQTVQTQGSNSSKGKVNSKSTPKTNSGQADVDSSVNSTVEQPTIESNNSKKGTSSSKDSSTVGTSKSNSEDSVKTDSGASPTNVGSSDYKSQSESSDKTVYNDDTIKEQSKLIDSNPSYIDKNDPYKGGSEIRPLEIGNWKFVKGNGNGLYALNNKSNEGNYFELSEPVDWALFNGQLNLSKEDYEKVVRYFNTLKEYMKANNIEINGFGG